MNNYRFDNRSKKQFIKDIKISHTIEVDIALRLCVLYHGYDGIWPKIIPHGVDMSGAFIQDDNLITLAPDFEIEGQKFEITRSNSYCKRSFHEKVAKIQSIIENKINLVFVNGYATNNPRILVLSSEQVKQYTKRAIAKYGKVRHPATGNHGLTNKPAYKYDIQWFDKLWNALPPLPSCSPILELESAMQKYRLLFPPELLF